MTRPASTSRYEAIEEMMKTMTQSEIASRLGVSQSAVARYISRNKLKVERDETYFETVQSKRKASARMAHVERSSRSDKRWSEYDLEEMYKTMNQSEIAAVVGVSQRAVSLRLKKLGIQASSRSQSSKAASRHSRT